MILMSAEQQIEVRPIPCDDIGIIYIYFNWLYPNGGSSKVCLLIDILGQLTYS